MESTRVLESTDEQMVAKTKRLEAWRNRMRIEKFISFENRRHYKNDSDQNTKERQFSTDPSEGLKTQVSLKHAIQRFNGTENN